MAKKRRKLEEPPLIIKFYQPNRNDKRWISYDIPDVLLETMVLEDEWFTSATPDDEYLSYYGTELSESAYVRRVAVSALMARPELPLMAGLTEGLNSTLFDFYPNIQFQWQNHGTGRFDIEPVLPKRKKFDLLLKEDADGSWIWQNPSAKIEVVQVDTVWVATCDPCNTATDKLKRSSLMAEEQDRNEVLRKLLNNKMIALTLGLRYRPGIALKDVFDVVSIEWLQHQQVRNKKHSRKVTNKPQPNKPSILEPLFPIPKVNRCSWKTVTYQCDGSYHCSFCASYGDAYFMRWDD